MKTEDAVHYTVERSSFGQWEVNDRSVDKRIASFSDKDAALDYARDLAELKESARVTVRD